MNTLPCNWYQDNSMIVQIPILPLPEHRVSVPGRAAIRNRYRVVFRFLTTLVCGCIAGSAPSLAAEPSYIDRTENLPTGGISSGTAGPTMDVATGDLNGDGFPDIVIAHEFIPNVILFNDGTGIFTNVTADALPQARQDSEDIAIADFDGDGDLDIVFVTEDDISHVTGESRKHEYYLNNGSGKFTAAPFALPDSKANAVAAADLTGDGFPDLVVGNDGMNYLLVNDGKGGFIDETATRLPEIFDITQDIKIADIDGDSDLDIMVGNEDRNRLLINNGKGVFADESMDRLPQHISIETRKVTIADVNADGAPDIFLSNVAWRQNKTVHNRLYINNGKGIFSDETESRLPEDNEFTLDGIFTDVDLDGDPDLVTVNIQQLPYKVYLNDGRGVFSVPTRQVFPGVYSGRGLAVLAADVNGDGIEDLYFGNRESRDNLLLHTGVPTGMLESVPAPPDGLRMFPNPCREDVTVKYEKIPNGIFQVKLFTQHGHCLYNYPHTWTSDSVNLAVGGLPAGIYTLHIQTGNDWSACCFIKE